MRKTLSLVGCSRPLLQCTFAAVAARAPDFASEQKWAAGGRVLYHVCVRSVQAPLMSAVLLLSLAGYGWSGGLRPVAPAQLPEHPGVPDRVLHREPDLAQQRVREMVPGAQDTDSRTQTAIDINTIPITLVGTKVDLREDEATLQKLRDNII